MNAEAETEAAAAAIAIAVTAVSVHDEQSVSLPSPSIFYIVRVVLFPSFHFILFGISVSIYSRRRFIVVARVFSHSLSLAAHRLHSQSPCCYSVRFVLILRCFRCVLCSAPSRFLLFGSTVSRSFFYYHSLLLYAVLFCFFNALTLSDAPIQCLPFVDTSNRI